MLLALVIATCKREKDLPYIPGGGQWGGKGEGGSDGGREGRRGSYNRKKEKSGKMK